MERGCIFYVKEHEMDNAIETLKNIPYQTIGYNQFISFS